VAADVRAILGALTGLPDGELVELGRGADSAAYLLDGEWVVRVPVTANAQRTLRRELALLDDLAPRLPLPIPAIAHVARRGGQLLLVAYPAIRGEPLDDERLRVLPAEVQHDLVSSLAAFLSALHAYPVSAARRAGVVEQLTSGGYHAAQRELPGMLAGVLTAPEIARLDACFARYEHIHPPQTASCAVLHADLKPDHVLHDAASGQITGVLDWGDVSLGDPDFDLAVIGMFFGPELLARLLEHLPDRDPAVVRDKARFFTTLRDLQDIRYALDHGDAATVQRAVARLRDRDGSMASR
jgi:aminoglycoside phosphotransferase (APT) family kinase protein